VKPAAFLPLLIGLALAGCKRQEPFEILQPPPAPTLQRLWQVPDFKFTERSGQVIQRADLAGKVWIADFFYT
jgi:cytochrome oxidase Cu insertion factor (SCO1/SenC/PrrC family)